MRAEQFERRLDRRSSNSSKWTKFAQDILPLWVADMDFKAPAPILEAIRRKLDQGALGYEFASSRLKETVAARMETLYGWEVDPGMVVPTPGVIAGFNAAARTVCQPGDGLLMQPPVYHPFLDVEKHAGVVNHFAPLTKVISGREVKYEIDWDSFRATIGSGVVRTGMFLLCHPHNPTGQVYTRSELQRMAEICAQEDIVICSDEIHSELLLGDASFTPMAAIHPEIAARTITLVSASKSFNIPGLFCGFAIIPDEALRLRYEEVMAHMIMHVSSLSLAAAEEAFSGSCDGWLADLRAYLTANRDLLVNYVTDHLPGIRTTVPEATYIAWLDCSELVDSGQIDGSPCEFFLEQGKVALSEGSAFGPGGENFVRLIFGCPQSTMLEGLDRMRVALDQLPGILTDKRGAE